MPNSIFMDDALRANNLHGRDWYGWPPSWTRSLLMAGQGGNVRPALADIARQVTSVLQRYEENGNGPGNTIENPS